MLNLETIDGYFRRHPLRARYFRFVAADRAGAAAVAERDVSAALDYAPVPEAQAEIFLAATAEQTLFLLLNPARLTGATDGVAAESSAGEHRSYRAASHPLGLRAAALIAPLQRGGNAALKLNRG